MAEATKTNGEEAGESTIESMEEKMSKTKRTKKDIIDEIDEIMKTDRFLGLFVIKNKLKTTWLEELCSILKAKNFNVISLPTEEEQELCKRCENYHRTTYGMHWCAISRERIDDFEHEKIKGESIPRFKAKDDSVKMTVKYECNHFKEVKNR